MSDKTTHEDARWLFWKWKRGGEILTKPDAYRIGNELERLQLLVTALQTELELLREQNARLRSTDDFGSISSDAERTFSLAGHSVVMPQRTVQTFREEPPATVDDHRPDPDEPHGDEP